MEWWLSVFFLVHGTWVPGHEMTPPGWSPRSYQSENECLTRKAFAEKQCAEHPLKFKTAWVCRPGAPALEPPADLAPMLDC